MLKSYQGTIEMAKIYNHQLLLNKFDIPDAENPLPGHFYLVGAEKIRFLSFIFHGLIRYPNESKSFTF